MKILIRYETPDLGPRVLVVEGGDKATATAIMNAHLALYPRNDVLDLESPPAVLLEEAGRFDMRQHLRRHKAKLAKAALKGENIVQLQPRKEKP